MGLIRCHECDSEISELAVSCPNCGAPSKSQLNLDRHNSKMVELHNELNKITTKNRQLKALLLCAVFALGFGTLFWGTIKECGVFLLLSMVIIISDPYHYSLKKLRNKIKIQSRIFESKK